MNKFLNEKLMPVAAKMAANKCLIAVRDGITLAMPLIIIGSLLMVIATGFAIPPLEKWLGDMGIATYLWKGSDSSFGLIGLVASFGIAHSLAKQYKVDGVSAGIISLSTFILVTPFVSGEAGNGMPTTYMAAQGLFVAIVLGLINGWVYQWFINHNIRIKMPESVPPAVSKSFSAILPGAALIVGWLIVYGVLDAFGLPNLHMIAKTVLGVPLGLLGNNIVGVVILVLCCSSLWFVGLHGGNIVNKIMEPIWLANLGENTEAFRAGEPLKHIFTTPFMDNFVYIGGAGATIGLVLALAWLARRKHASKQAKTLAPLTVVPGLFNINEPTMFGRIHRWRGSDDRTCACTGMAGAQKAREQAGKDPCTAHGCSGTVQYQRANDVRTSGCVKYSFITAVRARADRQPGCRICGDGDGTCSADLHGSGMDDTADHQWIPCDRKYPRVDLTDRFDRA